MAIAVVSWVQDRLGCDILGVVPETPEEAAKADSLKYITRISTRIVSLKDDLNRSLEECQAKLEHEDKPSIDGLREMEELYKFQNDVFTKQLYEVDNVVGDDEVRQSRKHCNTEIQVWGVMVVLWRTVCSLQDRCLWGEVVCTCAPPPPQPPAPTPRFCNWQSLCRASVFQSHGRSTQKGSGGFIWAFPTRAHTAPENLGPTSAVAHCQSI